MLNSLAGLYPDSEHWMNSLMNIQNIIEINIQSMKIKPLLQTMKFQKQLTNN